MAISTKITQFQSTCAALIQQVRLAPVIPTAWLPVSYVMAHIQIESGFDPTVKASDFPTTGSVGLMQVEAAVAAQVLAQYSADIRASGLVTVAQTDPLTSIITGMMVLYQDKNVLLPVFGAPLSYEHLAMAYNEGAGNVINGVPDWSYYAKWASAQRSYAFLDMPLMVSK